MTLTAEKLPFRGDTIQALMATADRVIDQRPPFNAYQFIHDLESRPMSSWTDKEHADYSAMTGQDLTCCQMEYADTRYVCGRKAVMTCTVCEVTQCDRCDCGCER